LAQHMNLRIAYFLGILFLAQFSSAQDNCEFKPTNKKGGHYLFSTYYLDDLQTPREGVCQTLHMGKIYERRVFVKGHLVEETCNTLEGNPRVQSNFSLWDGDSLLIDQRVYYENGPLQTHNIIYLDASGRRCMKSVEYGLTGHKRFEHTYAWIRYNELNESDKSMHPPHTVDDDGYTYLMVPIGEEKIYDAFTGALTQVRHHQFIGNGNHENSSLHGPSTEFFESGKVKVKANYKDGALNGAYKSFHLNGLKQSEGKYENGIQVGLWKGWHANGKQAYWYRYDLETAHPFEPNKKEWADNGQLTLEQVLDVSGTGYLREWTPQGGKTHDVDIYMLERTKGVETWWYDSGQLNWKRDYRKGQDTTMIQFYANGDPQRLEIYREKGLDTYRENRRWYPNKVPESVFIAQTRQDGFFSQSIEQYYPNGQLQNTVLYKNKECYKEFYASNGIKTRTLHTISDSLHGPYQELDSTGKLLLAYSYTAGLRDGWCREYDATGRLIFERYYEKGIPHPKYASVNKRKDLPSLTLETKQGLDRLIKIQRIDSLQFSKKEIAALVELAYRFIPEQFEPLPQTEYNYLREYNHFLRINLRRKGNLIWMDLSAYATSSLTLIIYPDMEIEIFNHQYTKEELNIEQLTTPKFYMWND
jgi:antitoxin component YwqK of YwqJK toxin-antitoxin module